MSDDDYGNILPFILGPGPRLPFKPPAAKPTPPKAPPPAPKPRPLLPTCWVQTAPNVWLVENPNVCGICHRAPHGPTAHHAFEPDRASTTSARQLGWPMPKD